MNVNIVRPIVIGMMAISALLAAGCDDLNTGLVKRGYSFLVNYPYKWKHPMDLVTDNIDTETSEATNAIEPKVAIDNHGNSIIVWKQYMSLLGETFGIYKSEFRNGKWVHPANLSEKLNQDVTAFPVLDYTLAMSDNGTAVIAWLQSDEGTVKVYVTIYRNGVWSAVVPVTSSGSDCVDVALNDAGSGYMVVNDAGIIYVATITDGSIGSWSWDPISDPSRFATAAQVSINNLGNAIIVWQQSDGSKQQIFMSEFKGGTWTKPGLTEYISSHDSSLDWCSTPSLAMSNNNSAIIAWTQFDGSGCNHIFHSYYNGTTWKHPSNPTDSDDRLDKVALGVNGGTDPKVAMDDKENIVVVWSANNRIQMSEYRNSTWSNPAYIDPDPGSGSSSNPSVAMNDGGKAVITWVESDGAYMHVLKSEYINGAWIHPSNIAADHIDAEIPTPRNAFNPQVALNNPGESIIAWNQIYQPGAKNLHHIYKSECRQSEEILPFLY